MAEFAPGLEGVIAFETEIAEPDKDGGSLRYRGVDIEDLVGRGAAGTRDERPDAPCSLQAAHAHLVALFFVLRRCARAHSEIVARRGRQHLLHSPISPHLKSRH